MNNYEACKNVEKIGNIAVYVTKGCKKAHLIKGKLAVTKTECNNCTPITEKEKQEAKKMSKGMATAIFKDIHNENVEVEDKITAIQDIAYIETHNSITKKEMAEVFRWLVDEYL